MNRDREKIENDFTSFYNPDPDPSSTVGMVCMQK